MTLIRLQHDRRLRYAGSGKLSLPALPRDLLQRHPGATVVTFRRPFEGRADRVVRRLHACRRWPVAVDELAGDLVLHGLETDSPLAPLLMWDAVHALPVGRAVVVTGEALRASFLQRAYYADDLEVESDRDDVLVLRKRSPLPAERDAGLDRWSFCIPVGPDDATLLNAAVRRILELDVPTQEIVLCGRPAANFLYGDRVRIVGEDIPAPPVRICAKKNRLAQEARYENLCILHDRVFLPRDFHRAVQRFGDHYPMVTLQSLYFDDRLNAVPRRYSDFNLAPRVRAQAVRGLMREDAAQTLSTFAPAVLARTEEEGFFYANARRHSEHVYATGSLYLCKRSVWLACPQDERLHWTEFEDIDHGLRAQAAGIPSRVNPYAITQSLNARPLLSMAGAVEYEDVGGGTRKYRAWTEPLPLPRKPLLRITGERGHALLARFVQRHTPPTLRPVAPADATLTSRARVRALLQATHAMRIPLQRKAIEGLLDDYEKQLVFDQSPYSWREWMLTQFLVHGGQAKAAMVRDNNQLLNHCSQRLGRSVFADDLRQFLPRRGVGVLLGSALSALSLSLRHRGLLHLPGGPLAKLTAILRSTPYADYAEPLPQAVSGVAPAPVERPALPTEAAATPAVAPPAVPRQPGALPAAGCTAVAA